MVWAGLVLAVLTLCGVLGWSVRRSGDAATFAKWVVDDGRDVTKGAIRVTFLGTTMFLVDDGSTQFFIDAFLTHVPLRDVFFGRIRTDAARVDAVLARLSPSNVADIYVAHSHHDHALDAAYLASATGATLRGSESTLNIGRGGGLAESVMRRSVPGDTIISGSFKVTVLESKHSSPVLGGEGAQIEAPLTHPSHVLGYKEGGSLDFLVRHPMGSMLFKSSAGFVPGALDGAQADVLFLSVATLARRSPRFQNDFAREVLHAVNPPIVVPTHWNDIFESATDHLQLNRKLIDDTPSSLHELRRRCDQLGCEFRLMHAFDRLVLVGR